jgi:hypothetical protein
MASANPISFSEIEAYCRLTWTTLHPWEVDAIKALDIAVLRTSAKRRSKGKDEPEVTNEVEASDGQGVKGLFRGMGAKRGTKK